MQIKKELWKDKLIRFIFIDGKWWAYGKDVTNALEYTNFSKTIQQHVDKEDRKSLSRKVCGETLLTSFWKNDHDLRNKIFINSYGIFSLIFGSKMKEANDFKHWVVDIIEKLGSEAGLQGFQMFAYLDKENQKDMMKILNTSLGDPEPISYIKANTIANKVTSDLYGFKKMVKKSDMTPQMMKDRETVLKDVVQLMSDDKAYHLDISISDKIYEKYGIEKG